MWHVYELPPIDFRWEHLKTVAETASDLAARAAAEIAKHGSASLLPDPADFLAAWVEAKDEASAAGWEGDFRDEPVVFWVPGDNLFEYGFVLKQDNNGLTYVVSPVELPHLTALSS